MYKKIIPVAAALLLFIGVQAQSLYPGQQEAKLAVKNTASFEAYAFDLKDVRLLPSRFTENMERSSAWILSIATESLLHSFDTNAGVFAGSEGGYDAVKKLAGWESLDCDLRGHITGHILSALALLYASTGKEIYKQKSDSLVNGLAEVQTALNQDGYLSAFPQNLIDRCIAGKSVWAPWYVLHKICAGLIDQYLYCDNKEALQVAEKMAGWAYNKLSKLTAEQRTVMLRNEFGGMNDAFYALYQLTGNEHDKWLGDFFYHNAILDPLKTGTDNLGGMHANTYIPKLIGVTRSYELGEPKENKAIADFFWNTVVYHHSFVTGSNSDREKFFGADQTAKHLSGYTGESCNVYNMLKLTRHLFCLEANEQEADYYEKALYNHILGQQDTVTGMVAYFLPMLPGAFKVYSTPDSSFWCCVGTGFENQAKYGEAIYYHNEDSLYVNLFIPSKLDWKDKRVQITQRTNFPDDDRSTLTINTVKPEAFTVKLRYPSWATAGATIKVNGKKIKLRQSAGTYISLTRRWKDGDKIEMEYPMKLSVQPTPDSANVVSVEYGPIVLAAEMGTENMQPPAPFSNPWLHNDYYTYDYHVPKDLSNMLTVKNKPVNEWLKPVQGQSLTFKTVKEITGKAYTLVPLYNLDRQRYIIYWDLH